MIVPRGQKVYFPNLVFALIRSGRERAQNVHTFRVPMFVNKLDIKHYLEKIYQVSVQKVETTIFLARTSRQGRRRIPARKNAIVTLAPCDDQKPFCYPPPPSPDKLLFPLENMQVKYPRFHKK